MTRTSPDDSIMPALTGELRGLLTRGGLFQGINLHISDLSGWVQLHVMAVTIGSLGMLLAAITDPAELDDPGSLSCRITPGDRRTGPGLWQYDLIATRYPTDNSIVFAAKIRFPVTDLPDVIGRLRQAL